MYNKRSRVSAILAILTALLLIGLMILVPFLKFQPNEGEELGGIALIIIIPIGYPLIFGGSAITSIVALIFGILMLKQKDRDRLISLNVKFLIAICVMLPVIAAGLAISSMMIIQSTLGKLPIIYMAILAAFYLATLIALIVTIVVLKLSHEKPTKMNEEEA